MCENGAEGFNSFINATDAGMGAPQADFNQPQPGINPPGGLGGLASVFGSGIGGILATMAGLGLAPFTGGLSLAPALAIDAGIGATGGLGGNLLGDAFSGSPVNLGNLGESAGIGGVTGVAGGLLGGAGGGLPTGSGDVLGTDLGTFGAAAGDAGSGIGSFDFGDLSGAFGGEGANAGNGLSAAVGTQAPGTGIAAAAPAGAFGASGGGSPAAGATAQSVASPFDTGLGAGGAPGAPGSDLGAFETTPAPGVASGSATATNSPFGVPNTGPVTGTGGNPGTAADVFTAPEAPADILGDNLPSGGGGGFDFANNSGAFGGLGSNPVPTAASLSGGGSGLSSAFGGVRDFIKSNKDLLGLGLGVGGIGRQLLQSGQSTPATAQLQGLFNQLQQQLQALQGGQLSPAQQQQFQNNLTATLAKIRSTYGSMGQGRSTSEMEDEAAATAASTGAQATAMSQNLQLALQGAGIPASIANQLLSQEFAQDQGLSQAISRLAAATLS